MDSQEIAKIIDLLGLQPLPFEGGLVAETYCAGDWLSAGALPARYGAPRRAGTAIYYALTDDPDSFSAFHSLLTDEVFHFYLGDAVEQVLLLPGGECCRQVLGQDLLRGQRVQSVVPAGAWQSLSLLPGGRFALLGTTMAPGYNQADFTLGERAALLAGWPAEAAAIARLTRN
jgi:predicted cupin superfamily sugar epimerase